MAQIRVEAGGARVERSVNLSPNEALLVGRDPDALAFASEHPELGTFTVRGLAIGAEKVSRHHAVISCSTTTTEVRDLRSTNGTWICLARGQTLRIEGTPPLHFALAQGDVLGQVQSEPAVPQWTRSDQYPHALAASVSAWFAELGLPLNVSVISGTRDAGAPHGAISLREGRWLSLGNLEQTTDGRLGRAMPRLVAFITRQNELFDARIGEQSRGMVLASPYTQSAWNEVNAAARAGLRLLLLGPSGAGKTALASCYHRAWSASGPYQTLNCSLLGRNTEWIRSALFGAAPGSYTGGPRQGVKGAIEQADGGTLFLDEVAELDHEAQAALLTFLDDGTFLPLGSTVERKAHVRLVCATNKDLRALVRDGRFRADLWYRIAGTVVEVRSLGDRPEDVQAFLTSLPEAREHRLADRLTPDAWRWLLRQPWSGGFRELRNFVQRLLLSMTAAEPIDSAQCHAALAGITLVAPDAPAAAHRPHVLTPQPESHPAKQWGEIVDEAFKAFSASDSNSSLTYDRLNQFIDQYLKPVFIGHACGLQGQKVIPREAQFEGLGERLNCAPGTVRTHIRRYMKMQQ